MSEAPTVDSATPTPEDAPDTTTAPEPPNLFGLVRWLTGITRAVHRPLFFSTLCRIIALSLDLALFGVAAGTAVHLAVGGGGITGWMTVLVVVALAKAAFFYLEQFSGHYVAFKALELLRTHVFAALWPKAPAVVTHSRSGDVLAGLTRDVDRIEVVYAHTFAPVVSAYLVVPVSIIVAGIVVGWSTIWIAAVCVVLSLFVVPYLGTRRALRATGTMLEARRDLAHHVTDTVFGIDTVLGYGREGDRLAEMDALGVRVAEASRLPRDFVGLRRGLNVTLSLIGVASVLWLGSGAVAPAALATLAAATLRLFEAPRGVEDATGYLDHSLSAARRLWEIAHAPEQVTDGPDTLTLDHAPSVRFDAVSYAYPTDDVVDLRDVPTREVIRDATLEVPAGGHAVLVGRSGSGKSTLVQLLLRYDDPDHGTISVDGRPVTRFTLDSLRRNVVVVSQRNQLLDTTLAVNLRLGAPDATDDELWAALATAGLAAEVRAMPDGLDTPVGRNGCALSGGQTQRACLARALVMDPRVLVLDEFTAHLDPALEARIRAALASDHPELTIIEITHRLEATSQADVVATVDHGRLETMTTPAALATAS